MSASAIAQWTMEEEVAWLPIAIKISSVGSPLSVIKLTLHISPISCIGQWGLVVFLGCL